MKWGKRMFPLLAALTVISPLLWACATTDGSISNEKITQADRLIREAKQKNASLSAPAELKAAEDNWAEAKIAYMNKDYEKAARLAERAAIDADYARAKAATAKSKATAEEMHKNIHGLREEVERLSKE